MLLSWLTGWLHDAPAPDHDLPAIRTSPQWREHFHANAEHQRDIPWDEGVGITPTELAEIAESLRAWQLGESSDGNHLRGIASKHAEAIGDADFVEMMECFIAEEQRHGAT